MLTNLFLIFALLMSSYLTLFIGILRIWQIVLWWKTSRVFLSSLVITQDLYPRRAALRGMVTYILYLLSSFSASE
jgi:hypothetical protein